MQEVHISNQQYLVALMIFFVAYTLFETPSTYCLKRVSPPRWIVLLMFAWGAMTMLLGAVHNFGALVAGLYGGALRGRVPGGAFVRERVARGCREDWRLDGAYTYAHEHEQGGSGVAGGTGGSR